MLNPVFAVFRTRRWGAGLVIAGTAFCLLVIASIATLGYQAIAARPEPWPAFTMTYRDTAVSGGPGGAAVTQTFRLTYLDQRHFRTDLIAHSTNPEAVGWTHIVNGTSSTTTDPRLGPVQAATFRPDELTVPDDWPVPASRPRISYQSGVSIVALSGGLLRATSSYTTGGRAVVEELTYRDGDGIPTSFVRWVDGQETRRVEVLELTISN
jgi:hypothetical protein